MLRRNVGMLLIFTILNFLTFVFDLPLVEAFYQHFTVCNKHFIRKLEKVCEGLSK